MLSRQNLLPKRLISAGIIVLTTLCVPAQSPKQKTSPDKLSFEYESECGNPEVESMAWSLIFGRVTKVVGGHVLILQTPTHQRFQVSLIAVDSSSNEAAAHLALSDFVLNRTVEVALNRTELRSSKVTGVVSLGPKDINRTLIEAGLARYRAPKSYAMSNYTACVYRIVEKEAREAKRGLWKTTAN